MEIAVRLHDRDFNPTPNVAYQLTLASGETTSGTTCACQPPTSQKSRTVGSGA